jgi:hypothetical protein
MSGTTTIRYGAGLSDCGTYRYWLTRTWDDARPPLAVVGLNPSTADAEQDDPTIRRCMGFAWAWGHGGLVMLNLFALRSTDPKGLRRAFDPVGPANDATLLEATKGRRVLCAWGAHGTYCDRNRRVLDLFNDMDMADGADAARDLVCLGTTQDGHPRHPLYVRADQPPVLFCWLSEKECGKTVAQLSREARR